jgi:hypothetical protein
MRKLLTLVIIMNVTICTTKADTVITPKAVVAGTAIDKGFDGYFETLINGLESTFSIGRIMPPDSFQSERRGILEFDISTIPHNAYIEKATLYLAVVSYGGPTRSMKFYGYAGNGVLDATDPVQTNNLLASNLHNYSGINVTPFVQNMVDNSHSYAGFLGVETVNGANSNFIVTTDPWSRTSYLEINYVPEPASLFLLALGAISLRNKKSKT